MPDPFDPPTADPLVPGGGDQEPPEESLYPWDAEPLPDEADGVRRRHDAFTEQRKRKFLAALVKTGCIEDACRLVGVGKRTVYRHQQDSPGFFDNCAIAVRMASTPLELTAWQRAVDGVEQEFAVGGEVRVRRRYDGGLLRLLLQGSNPRKYGPRPGFTRKRLLKHERKQMEREIRAEIAAETPTFDEAMEMLGQRLNAMNIPILTAEQIDEEQRLEAGWTKSPGGDWVPPGYGPLSGFRGSAMPGRDGLGEGPPHDSM